MKNLEYRLDDNRNYPALWFYTQLSTSELVARMTCEYFIKENKTYSVTGTRKEKEMTIIFIKEETVTNEKETTYPYIGFEIKEILAMGRYHTIERREIFSHEEALELLHYDVILIDGRELHLDSRELDEDRNCYIYYGKY
jgi:hypothetical protein